MRNISALNQGVLPVARLAKVVMSSRGAKVPEDCKEEEERYPQALYFNSNEKSETCLSEPTALRTWDSNEKVFHWEQEPLKGNRN